MEGVVPTRLSDAAALQQETGPELATVPTVDTYALLGL